MSLSKHKMIALIALCNLSNCYAVDAIHIQADSVSFEGALLQAPVVDITLHSDSNINISVVSLQTKASLPNKDYLYHIAVDCELPKSSFSVWQCEQGLISSLDVNFPFSIDANMHQEHLNGSLTIMNAKFSDASGLHAAEGLEGKFAFEVDFSQPELKIQHTVDWTAGEIYWEPYYLEGAGHQLEGDLLFSGDAVQFDQLAVSLNNVGTLNLTGKYDLKAAQLLQLNANLPDLDLGAAFPLLFKPLLEESILQQTDLSGRIALTASVAESQLKSFDLRLHDVSVKDQQGHFAFEHINAHIPWDYDAKQTVTLSYQQGQLRSLPLGAAQIGLEVNRYAWTAPKITMPILDGALVLKNLSAARLGGRWHWHVGADIQNLGMPQLSEAFGWPTMQGSATVHIPQVIYSNASLLTDGELVFKVFDGETIVSNLSLDDPLGNAPRLSADLSMRALDLGQLTETFSFGTIEGKLDGDVNGLVLQNWQPVAFDARFVSSPGRYRKKISQRAVENISALGGAGAVAAIQRSVLRFFEAFNYAKIGISCRLQHDVCTMAGLPDDKAKSTDEGYLIVKGRGIPAISVKGFNKTVGWDDLLSRVQRITNENTEAVVR